MKYCVLSVKYNWRHLFIFHSVDFWKDIGFHHLALNKIWYALIRKFWVLPFKLVPRCTCFSNLRQRFDFWTSCHPIKFNVTYNVWRDFMNVELRIEYSVASKAYYIKSYRVVYENNNLFSFLVSWASYIETHWWYNEHKVKVYDTQWWYNTNIISTRPKLCCGSKRSYK